MSLRDLPSVERLLQRAAKLEATYGRPLTLEAIRDRLDAAREAIREGHPPPQEDILIEEAHKTLDHWLAPTLQPVINATGVIIHTNLGRAPLCRAARQAMIDVAEGYSTLEYNLKRGVRGKREDHAEGLLTRLTGGEAAFVVNNNAAAVLLALTSMARRKDVIVSRSQLIEIGGGFRIPDIMKQSGAKLIEVGTTNRTHLQDYEDAIHERTGLILRVHHSNFRIIGFTTEPALGELVDLGKRYDIPVLDDLGSGALIDTAQFGLGHEPMVQESLGAGASLVAFSGDKLLGGPQAGILIGKKPFVDRLRRHPLSRAVRPDKLCLAALVATLRHYLRDDAVHEIPIWQMIAAPLDQLQKRSEAWAERLGQGEVIPGQSTVGGGSLPEETLPSSLLALSVRYPNAFTAHLRGSDPPIIARIEDDRVVLDPRTVLVEQEEELLRALEGLL
ncbi:MAG: L-seryl-tRNA(Sec) selenium transferase [Anaerolineae bacterium SM23_ 63]|nr:MAG: L-seryl-tRNA(Sec) selenium transferase [Anaerolineae bacterium SM23_ 63]HEY47781.1 L-seryl-tRNA(Sec) selenium transferase [Anaerolineae bacterium]